MKRTQYPTCGLAVDGSGNVFVTTSFTGAVVEIPAAGGYASANTLASGFNDPKGLAADGSGNIFFAEKGNSKVKEILAAGGYTTITTLGRGFNQPSGVAVDASGNVFVADTVNDALREIMTPGVYFGSAAVTTSTPITIPITFTL